MRPCPYCQGTGQRNDKQCWACYGSGNNNPLFEVERERARQVAKWGGAEHDDQHSTQYFAQMIIDYAGWVRAMANMQSPGKARRRLIQIAALAIAAVESIDRKNTEQTLEQEKK